MLKDLAEIRRLTSRHSVADHMAMMQSSMERMTATMSSMISQGAGMAAMTGRPGRATIVAARSTGMMLNVDHVVEFDFVVLIDGVATPVTRTDVVSPLNLAKAQPGNVINVRVGATPADLYLDWLSS